MSATTPDPDGTGDLGSLVGDWLTLPDLAEALGVDLRRVRGILHDRDLVGVKHGERAVFQVPAAFVVPAHLVDPANVRPETDPGARAVLGSLHGTVVVLTDLGFDDAEIIAWLFSVEESLGVRPIDALLAGRKAEVRRVAQALL